MANTHFKDKVALITGSSRGIGLAIAVEFARHGAAVALLSKTPRRLAEAAAHVRKAVPGARVATVKADVRQRKQVERAVSQAVKHLDCLDVLVNSAGVASLGAIDEMPPGEWEEMMRVNVLGTYYAIRAVWPHFRERGEGSIINLSSGSGRRAHANWSAYCASKFAVMGLTDALQKEGRPFGIRVNVICPGPTDTDQRRENFGEEDPAGLMRPEDIAKVAVFFASDDSRWVSGPGLDVRRNPI